MNSFCYTEMAVEAISEAIIEAMKHGDGRTRCLAAKVLGTVKARKSVPVLTGYLNDEDPDVRCDAAAALGEIGDPQAVPPLIQSLNDEDGLVRICAVQALGKLGAPPAVEPLIHAMTSADSFPYFLGELSGDYQWEIREKAVEALGKIRDPKSVEGLIDFLKDEDADLVLERVFRSLIESGDKRAQKTVAGYLKDPDPIARQRASKAFIHTKNRDVIEDLMETLIDGDSMVKVNLIDAIGNIGSEKEIIPLIFLLKDEGSDVRIKAAEAMFKIGGEKTIKYFLPLIQDPVKDVRKRVIGLLADAGSEECIGALINLVTDKDEEICGEAILALGKIGNDRAVPSLIALLEDKKRGKELRSKALFALGKIGVVDGLQAIMDVLLDREEAGGIREMAVQVLSVSSGPAILDRIRVDLKGSDEFAKKGIARLLRDFKDPQSEEILLSLLLREESEGVQREAAVSLAYRGKDAGLDVLISLIAPSLTSAGERMDGMPELYDCLKNIRNERAVGLLLRSLASGTPSLRCFAARAAGQTDNRVFIEPLIALLSDEDKDVRRDAVIALGRLGDKGVLTPLLETLYDYERFDDLRSEVACACKWIDAERTTELCLDILMDPEKKEHHWVMIKTLLMMYNV